MDEETLIFVGLAAAAVWYFGFRNRDNEIDPARMSAEERERNRLQNWVNPIHMQNVEEQIPLPNDPQHRVPIAAPGGFRNYAKYTPVNGVA